MLLRLLPPWPTAAASVARGREGVAGVYADGAWDPLMRSAAALGRAFDAGGLKACYIANQRPEQFILRPADPTAVVAVRPDCPRDIIVKVLYG